MKYAYVIQDNGKEGDEQRTFWHRCGVAFECNDGSLNLQLDLFPGLTINIREPKEKEEPKPAKKAR